MVPARMIAMKHWALINFFRDIAWGLAEQGIAVLRYDKRTKVYGTAAYPQGVEATFDNEVVDDVISAVRLVKSLPEIDSARVYVLGHSLGGMLVPRIAQRAGEGCLGGIISLADRCGRWNSY